MSSKLRLVSAFALLLSLFSSCSIGSGSSEETVSSTSQQQPTYPRPTDIEEQPTYTLGEKAVLDDTDGDKVCDYLDFFPEDPSKSSPDLTEEEEFNNNISVANPVTQSQLPFGFLGALAEGQNYYVDADYYSFDLKKGDRVSFILFKGQFQGGTLSLKSAPWNPRLTVLQPSGRTVTTVERDTLISKVFSFEVPEDGTYYVEVSYPDVMAKDYSYSYTVFAVQDSDFDGVPDSIEKVLGSKPETADTDGDGISDYDEIYAFAYQTQQLANLCSGGQNITNYWDVDGDGIPNWYDVDSDGDGVPDRVEGTADDDGDFIPNFVDTDSNGDGKPDTEEVGLSFQQPMDTDGDRVPDFADPDMDNDGIPNSIDNKPIEFQNSAPVDTENNLILYASYSELNGKKFYHTGFVGKPLVLVAKNLGDSVVVLFSSDGKSEAVKPTSIDKEQGLVEVNVPSNLSSGNYNVYLYDENLKVLSNDVGVRVYDLNKDTLITEVDSPLYVGDIATIKGFNLGKGNVSVIFTNGVVTVQAQGVSDGDTVQFTVPDGAPSGYIKVQSGQKESNMLKVQVLRKVTVSVSSQSVNTSALKISVLGLANEYSLDSSGTATVDVETEKPAFVESLYEKDLDGDGSTDYGLIYEGVVLPGESAITLNAKTTVVKWLFYDLGLYRTLSPSEWQKVIDCINNMPEVDALAQKLDQLLKQDPLVISKWNNDELKELFKKAVEAFLTNYSKSFRVTVKPDIKPSEEQFDISLTPVDVANVELANDTKLYLSVEAVAKDGTKIEHHVSSPWDPDIIGPQGWGLLFIATKKELKLQGRDSDVEVITAGLRSPLVDSKEDRYVHGCVNLRTVFDGIVAPIVSTYFIETLTGIDPDSKTAVSIIMELEGPTAFSNYITALEKGDTTIAKLVGYFLTPLEIALNSCLQVPPGATCQNTVKILAKVLGLDPAKLAQKVTSEVAKKVLAKFVPVVGQIDAILDIADKVNTGLGIAVTGYDMAVTPELVRFEVDYPLEVDDVRPSCVNLNTSSDRFNLIVEGKGFAPYTEGHLWWKREVPPEVYLGKVKGKVLYVNGSGTLMNVQFSTKDFTDGDYELKVKHQGQEASYQQKIKVSGKQSIFLTRIDPDTGVPGDIVTLYGCGFVPDVSQTSVYFSSQNGPVQATVLSVKPGEIQVIVPQEAETGDVYVESGGVKSNSLQFTVSTLTLQISFGDCGPANDDTFALYVDGKLIYSMPQPARPFPVDVELSPGNHEVSLVGITAPDNIGTYCISFPSNVTILSGPPTSGDDLTAGVVKKWLIYVDVSKSGELPVVTVPFPGLQE